MSAVIENDRERERVKFYNHRSLIKKIYYHYYYYYCKNNLLYIYISSYIL
jgi:hypothetical protein